MLGEEQLEWLVSLHHSIRDEAQFNRYDWMEALVMLFSDKAELQGLHLVYIVIVSREYIE